MKKIMSLVITGVLAAATVVAAPVAAQAAPKNLDLPSKCTTYGGVTKKISFKEASAKQADVHPNKGKEYVYVASCLGSNGVWTERLVITNSKGKALTTAVVGKDTISFVSSASKKSGIKLQVADAYQKHTGYLRVDSAKVNSKTKKIKITKGKVPGYVKPAHNLSTQLAKGKKVTAVSGSKANVKKLSNFGKAYKKAKASDRFAYCTPAAKSSKNGVCTLSYFKGSKIHNASFDIAKSGKKYKVSKVKTSTTKPPAF